jgi:alcohol dehydrogenase
MAVREQVYGFFIPSVTLIGIGAYKEIGNQIKTLGGKKPFICTDKGITGIGMDQMLAVISRCREWIRVVYRRHPAQPHRQQRPCRR